MVVFIFVIIRCLFLTFTNTRFSQVLQGKTSWVREGCMGNKKSRTHQGIFGIFYFTS